MRRDLSEGLSLSFALFLNTSHASVKRANRGHTTNEWFSIIHDDLYSFLRQILEGIRFLYAHGIPHLNVSDGIFITPKMMAKIGNVVCDQDGQISVQALISKDFKDLERLVVRALGIPGYWISGIGELERFLGDLRTNQPLSFEEARVMLDDPLFYTTVEGLNLFEKLYTVIFDKEMFDQVEIDYAISASAHSYPMLMSWCKKINYSVLAPMYGHRRYMPRNSDVLRWCRNCLEHNGYEAGRAVTYRRIRNDFGNIVGEFKALLDKMMTNDPTFKEQDIHIIRSYFDSSKMRNEDEEVARVLVARMPPQNTK